MGNDLFTALAEPHEDGSITLLRPMPVATARATVAAHGTPRARLMRVALHLTAFYDGPPARWPATPLSAPGLPGAGVQQLGVINDDGSGLILPQGWGIEDAYAEAVEIREAGRMARIVGLTWTPLVAPVAA